MYWLYFVRDFYRTGAARDLSTAAVQPSVPSACAVEVAKSYANAFASAKPVEPAYDALVADARNAASSDSLDVDAADDLSMLQVQEDVLLLSRKMQKLQAALAVSDRGRSSFLSSMSHELRTPLNAIMGFSDMMKSGVFGPIDNPTYAQYVTHIHDSGALLLSKINDLLDIASMDADKLQLEESDCDIQEILDEVLEIHSHNAFAREITIHLDGCGTVHVHADRNKLLCVLSHFVSNALRHSPDGGVITVMARVSADDGVVFSVRDAGEGIASEQLRVIREALQAPIAYQHIECGGIGLGLSLSKEIAEYHGGRVTIESMRRRGTVASLLLPAERIISDVPRAMKSRIETGEWRLV